MSNNDHQNMDEDRDVAQLLKAIGAREQPPELLFARWEKRFREELQARREMRRRRTRLRYAAGLFTMILVVAALQSVRMTMYNNDFPSVQVVAVGSTSPQLNTVAAQAGSLTAGQVVADGSLISTGATELASLDYAGYDLRLNTNTQVTFSGKLIQLTRGTIYVSSESGRTHQSHVTVETPFGLIRDVGTQFTVAVSEETTVATVRSGALLLEAQGKTFRADSEISGATRMTVGHSADVTQSVAAPNGGEWRWIYNAGRSFQLDGSTALEFLRWSAAESGAKLKFESEAARIYASSATLHGSLRQLDPESAVSPVLSATDLEARSSGNALVVSLRPRF